MPTTRLLLPLLAILSACSDQAGNTTSDRIEVTNGATIRQPGPAPAETRGQEFVSAVEGGFQFVLESTRMVDPKAEQAKVQQFARKLQTDVEALRTELGQIAAASRLQLAPAGGETTYQSDLAVLSSTKGDPLERAFAEQQVETLTALVGLIRAYGDGGDNPQLKAWATRAQSVVNDRLMDVQTLRAELETVNLPADQR